MKANDSLLKKISKENSSFKVGNDILFLPDFYNTLNNLFINKVFTDKEKEYANQFSVPKLRYASTFSAKESIYKAIKQWYPKEKIWFKSIEILRNKPSGIPTVIIHHSKLNKLIISLSISHDGEYVWTIATVELP